MQLQAPMQVGGGREAGQSGGAFGQILSQRYLLMDRTADGTTAVLPQVLGKHPPTSQ